VTENTDPQKVAERLEDLVVELGLKRATALTDTHRVIVQEPSIWDDGGKLEIEVRELDL
jgi:hypothetical protein